MAVFADEAKPGDSIVIPFWVHASGGRIRTADDRRLQAPMFRPDRIQVPWMWIPSVSEPNMYCSNGMSNSRHDTPFANSGLVVTLEPEYFGSRHPLAGVELQRKYESAAFHLTGGNYEAPIQRAKDFLDDRTPPADTFIPSSYQRGTKPQNLSAVLPPEILKAMKAGLPVMDAKWKGKYLPDAVLVGPEMRGSSPVRIDRDRQSFQIPNMPGIYPVGEGAGYAGGIVTAAVDGLLAARKIVEQFAPPE